jgi:hypothetical protein
MENNCLIGPKDFFPINYGTRCVSKRAKKHRIIDDGIACRTIF